MALKIPRRRSTTLQATPFAVFLLLSGIFHRPFRLHSPLCSRKMQAKFAQIKPKNPAKIIFRTSLNVYWNESNEKENI
jgi:hypothetical protein